MRPFWGGRKLHAQLWPEGGAPVCARTVDRILERHGLCACGPPPPEAVGRFERGAPNELWQVDFKGLGAKPPPYRVLSAIDDHSRFLTGLRVVERPTNPLVFDALWAVFEAYGLPEAVLTDNEGCFHHSAALGPSYFEARLWRLGVKTPHGRAGHPQTQGKVERFHRTLQTEHGHALRGDDPALVAQGLERCRQDYNWGRPHQAIGMRTPGQVYRSSTRPRPQALPEAPCPERCELRKVDHKGLFKHKGGTFRAGKGLAGEAVAVHETEEGLVASYANVTIATLERIKV